MRRIDQRRLEAMLGQLRAAVTSDAAAVDGDVLDAVEVAAENAADRLRAADDLVVSLGAALDLVTEGVVMCDSAGREIFRNAKAASYVSARLGDALAEQALAVQLDAARRGEYPEQILELFSPTRRNLLIRAFPVIGPAGPIGAVAVVEDISERRRLDAIRRDFVANVSHELKTPVGALSLLAETLDGEDDPAIVARLSARVATEAERLGHLIDDLLDLSRIEANETPTHDVVPVQQIVGEALETLRPFADSYDIKLDVSEPVGGVAVPGDRRDLVSAVSNLVDNAIKYSEPGSLVRVRVEADAATVHIAVSDNGIGIPARDLERIFERFYRVDRARSRSTGGTGLGLAIVRHVAANHGGSVHVASIEGEGSTFTLSLPVGPVGPTERESNA